jgi:Flp pilus assembly protein TadG
MKLSHTTAQHDRFGERGTAIVEAAIFMLAMFMFIFGVMEAGRFLNVEQVLTNAAREGARFGVAPETAETCATTGPGCLPTSAEIQAVVENYLASARIRGATIIIDQDAVGPIAGTSYTSVIVRFDYDVLTVASYFSSTEITLQGEALMRNETSP